MREVNPSTSRPQTTLKEVIDYLILFLKNPAEQIRHLPRWSWSSLFMLQVTIAITSGIISGLLVLNFYRMLFGLILMPIVSTAACLLLTNFFYYYFQFFENRTVSFRRLLTFVILSSIPFFLFQILAEYVRFISLIGFGFTSLLAIIGLKESFQVEKKRAIILISILFSLALATWIFNQMTVPS